MLGIIIMIGLVLYQGVYRADLDSFAGVTYHGFEIYGGFRSIKAKYAKLRGFETGVRYWF